MSRRSHRPARLARRAPIRRRPILESLEPRELLTGFQVMNNLDSGAGSLRAAITAVNADNVAGADTISFGIVGGGLQTIVLKTALPALTRTVTIDASTQPGFTGTGPVASPAVVIDGSGVAPGADGLSFTGAGGNVVRGLSIVGFTSGPGGGGSGILLGGSGGNVIQGNDLGVLPDGSTPRPNTNGIVVLSSGNSIGATGNGHANLISGNAGAGVLIYGPSATGNRVTGDRIGTDSTGFFGVGNTVGVLLAAPNNTVGGASVEAGNVISGNVGPTGQTGVGVLLIGASTGDLVQGNLIGTDASGGATTGTGDLPNVYGIYFGTPGGSKTDMVALDTIGGTTAGTGNVISGNFIGITGNVFTSLIAGNTIGLASGGARAVPNGDGILLGATGTTIGGTTPAARNVISASNTVTGTAGTGLDLTGDRDLVQGNFVGLTPAGIAASGFSNVTGIALHTTNSTIGGTTQAAANVIANNSGDAITLDNNGSNLIQGNYIGFTSAGVTVNGGNGIDIIVNPPSGGGPLTLNDTIGGTAAGAGNTITGSFNGSGIAVHNSGPMFAVYPPFPSTPVIGLTIRGNAIYANGRIGIDLAGNNTPIPGTLFITSATPAGGGLTISGTFTGSPSTTYGLDLFGNTAAAPVSPTGFGPGQFFLGSVNVTTDPSGFATFSPTVATPQAPLVSFSGTATGPDATTSEFSANFPGPRVATSADLAVTATASAASVIVGSRVTLTETVTNNGPDAASAVVLTDTLPTGLVNARVTAGAGTASVNANNVVTAQIGTLAAGGSVTVTITGNASQQGPLVDAPGVSSTTLDPNFSNNATTQTITVTPAPGVTGSDLAITQTASPASATLGTNLTYTLTVTNNGPVGATNVTINEFLPGGVTLVGVQPSQGAAASVNGTLIVDNLGAIAAGASATLTVVVTPTAAGTYTNAANVSGNQLDSIPGNNTTSISTVINPVTVVTPSINLQLSASVFPTVGAVGAVQLFTFTVTNAGPDPATNVTIIDRIPTNAVFLLAGSSQGGAATLANFVITSDVGTLAAGASATLTVALVPTSPGGFFNYGGAFTPDVPTATPSFAFGAVPVPAPAPISIGLIGPGVTGLAGSGRNRQLILSFNEPLAASTATHRSNYILTATKGNRRVSIVGATFNPGANSVTLTPSSPLDPSQTYRLVVVGTGPSGITDPSGHRLVGTAGGQAGTSYTANFFAGALPQV